MRERVIINEVGLRDGLQNQRKILSTQEKIAFFDSLAATGLRHFELTSFVSPKAVPQLADASEVLAQVGPRSGFDLTCLRNPTSPANVTAVSGRGVFLMRAFMDEVVYSPTGNEVTMTKFRPPRMETEIARDGAMAAAPSR